MRDRNLLKVKVRAIPRVKRAALGFWICACIYNWCRNRVIYPFLGPAHRILEKQRPFDHRCTKRKNLTHLQSILLFKDSSEVAAQTKRYVKVSPVGEARSCCRPTNHFQSRNKKKNGTVRRPSLASAMDFVFVGFSRGRLCHCHG